MNKSYEVEKTLATQVGIQYFNTYMLTLQVFG